MAELYSHSRLSTFEQCPLKYRLRYIDKAEPEFKQTVEAFLGSVVHNVLEEVYNNLKFQKVMTLQETLDIFNKQWKEGWSDDIKIIREGFDEENYRKMGIKFLTDYHARFYPFDQERHISCEERVIIKFGENDKYQLQGYIDRLSSDASGTYYVHDYKTANSFPHQDKADDDRQLALYSIAVKDFYRDCKKVKLVWHYLAFDKDVISERDDSELEELKRKVAAIIDEIESAKEYPPRQSALCGWCEFRHLCPNFKHLYRIENMLDNEHMSDDGVSLANKYSKLKAKEAEVKKELDKVSEAIYNLGEKEGISCLYGDEDVIRIWSKECVKFPPKSDPIIPELKKLLKGINRFDEVAMIDLWELSKIVEKKGWPEDALNLLSGFYRKELVRRLYLSKRKR